MRHQMFKFVVALDGEGHENLRQKRRQRHDLTHAVMIIAACVVLARPSTFERSSFEGTNPILPYPVILLPHHPTLILLRVCPAIPGSLPALAVSIAIPEKSLMSTLTA